ncbi:MAG: serine--tRNA ligase [Candidatus Nanoarchaeia archaeon]
MLDISLLRERPDIIKKSLLARGLPTDIVDWAADLDSHWRTTQQKLDELRHVRNLLSEKINQLKKEGKSVQAELAKAKEIAKQIENLEIEAKNLKDKRDQLLFEMPNILDPDVPFGKDESENKEIKRVGKPKHFTFTPLHHQDLLASLDCLDIEQAAKVAGARFYYLKNELVKLNLALILFSFNFLVQKGMKPIQPPYMLNKAALSGAIHISTFEDAIYKIENEDLYLIATAEHPVVAYLAHKIVPKEELPLRFVGISPCFRKEAGAHGKDTKGIFRVHQFEKVEQVSFCEPSKVKEEFEFLLKNSEQMLKALKIPYRLVFLCSGDTGKAAAKTIDFEGWFPAQQKYRELGSCSNLNDYQARRLDIKYFDGKKTAYLATLNNTGIAMERTLACIVENNQQKDGSIKIPKVLWPYTKFKVIEAKAKKLN